MNDPIDLTAMLWGALWPSLWKMVLFIAFVHFVRYIIKRWKGQK